MGGKVKMKIIGLTGGIGCGKSTVAQLLKELGAVVYDQDQIGHDVIQKNGGAYKKVLSAFGESILAPDGEIDRLKLGQIVFNNPDALKRLNSIVHPAIDEKINTIEKGIKEGHLQGRKVIVMEAAAMLEAGRSWQANEIWVVTCPENSVIGRIKSRPGYSEEVAKSRIHSQMTNDERLKKADVVIKNDGTLEELKAKVKTEWEKLLKRL
jgi:dephospho-CoA kinase